MTVPLPGQRSAIESTKFHQTQLPVDEVILPLEKVVADLATTLKEVKVANQTIKASVTQLTKLTEKKASKEAEHKNDPTGPAGFWRGGEINQLSAQIRTQAKTIERSQARLAQASEKLKEIAKDHRIQGFEKPTPQVAKIKALVEKLKIEIHKQDESNLKNIEKKLSAITGNSIFNSIFRIKRVKDGDLSKLMDLAQELKAVKDRPERDFFSQRIFNLEMQLGRALMLGEGYRTEKDLDQLLEGAHYNRLPLEEAQLMLHFIRNKFPNKNVRHMGQALQNASFKQAVESFIAHPEKYTLQEGKALLKQLMAAHKGADTQDLMIQLHKILAPSYLDDLAAIYSGKYQAAEADDLDPFHFSINLRLLEAYHTYPEFKQKAANMLMYALIDRYPQFIEKAERDLKSYQSMSTETFTAYKGNAIRDARWLGYISESKILPFVANKAHTLKRGYEQLLRNKS